MSVFLLTLCETFFRRLSECFFGSKLLFYPTPIKTLEAWPIKTNLEGTIGAPFLLLASSPLSRLLILPRAQSSPTLLVKFVRSSAGHRGS